MHAQSNPLVSVVLPVLDGEKYIQKSMMSILEQTYSNLELIVVVDPSSDKTIEVVESINDPRVKVLVKQEKGLPASLNLGIKSARGEYIARQDHDDISLHTRIEKQVAYLKMYPEISIVGTYSKILEGEMLTNRGHRHPCSSSQLRFLAIFNSYFVGGSVMIRRSIFEDIGLHSSDPSRSPPEDFELWSRINRKYKMGNLSEELYLYREIASSITRTVNFDQQYIQICSENIALELGVRVESIHRSIPALMLNKPELIEKNINFLRVKKLIKKIGNKIDNLYPNQGVDKLSREFIDELATKYEIFCCKNSILNKIYLVLSRVWD